MTREIKTPADAEPHDYDHLFEKRFRHMIGRDDIGQGYFTAAECAQIAEAYSESEKSDPDMMMAWRAKFEEWLKAVSL